MALSIRLLKSFCICVSLFAVIILATPVVLAQENGNGIIEPGEDEEEELARAVQNPVADLISVPFQNNWNFDAGPYEKTQYLLNIQPVYPIELNDEWNLITRTIVPILSQPKLSPGGDRETGLGDIQLSAFLTPAKPDKLIWGAGPVFRFPSATEDVLGSEKWSAGPSAVALTMSGPWVLGALVQNVWSFAGTDKRDDVNQFLMQPFINYNFPNGWYITSSPIITADWEADSDNMWTIPIGGGFGKVIEVGKLPVNINLAGYYNVENPNFGPEWSIRFTIQFLFPKSRK